MDFEPDAWARALSQTNGEAEPAPIADMAIASLALSAKRIADALEIIARNSAPDRKRDEAATRRDFIGIGSGD